MFCSDVDNISLYDAICLMVSDIDRFAGIASLYHSGSRSVTVQYDDLVFAFDVVVKTRLFGEYFSICLSLSLSNIGLFSWLLVWRIVVVNELVRIGGWGFYEKQLIEKIQYKLLSILPFDVVEIVVLLMRCPIVWFEFWFHHSMMMLTRIRILVKVHYDYLDHSVLVAYWKKWPVKNAWVALFQTQTCTGITDCQIYVSTNKL